MAEQRARLLVESLSDKAIGAKTAFPVLRGYLANNSGYGKQIYRSESEPGRYWCPALTFYCRSYTEG